MLLSPARVLARLRDAYVDAMLALAAARTCAAMARPRVGAAAGAEYQTASALWAKRVPRARTERHGSASSASEFERRMMAHIYNALVTPEVAMA
ncbi:hypothetical protein BRADI_2g15681v3 [Brachypodium distachyon]|uniref:Uncharacterized protein n=2 Tax=Brachypodium distachyon TaxID=15368 RepID=A0A0Q3K1Y6_BRADI|nr:hypothetical protein BRADI_2g15681v3 [Brachypodium distachyon]